MLAVRPRLRKLFLVVLLQLTLTLLALRHPEYHAQQADDYRA
jgi:hypothetical protein